MSWLEGHRALPAGHICAGRRAMNAAALATAVAAALVLGACADGSGFRPLYATTSATGGPGTEQKLAQVEIQTIPGRVGQRVRNELVFQRTGGGEVQERSVYRLEISLREQLTSTLVDRTGDAAGQIYAVDATFKLVRIADRKVVLTGTSYARAGFERYTTIYSNVRAREDAENRAAGTIATDLKVRLAAYLSGQT